MFRDVKTHEVFEKRQISFIAQNKKVSSDVSKRNSDDYLTDQRSKTDFGSTESAPDLKQHVEVSIA